MMKKWVMQMQVAGRVMGHRDIGYVPSTTTVYDLMYCFVVHVRAGEFSSYGQHAICLQDNITGYCLHHELCWSVEWACTAKSLGQINLPCTPPPPTPPSGQSGIKHGWHKNELPVGSHFEIHRYLQFWCLNPCFYARGIQWLRLLLHCP